MPTQVIIEIASVIVASCMGMIAYRSMNKFYRVVFLQLLTWLLLYSIARVVTHYQKSHGEIQNNQWVFNIQILIETSLLTLSAYYSGYLKEKQFLSVPYGLFLILYLFGISREGFFILNANAYLFECLFMTSCYCMILFRALKVERTQTIKEPLLWTATGLLIYFACNTPYFGLFHLLNSSYASVSKNLHMVIIDSVSNIRYISLAISFWLVSRKHLYPNSIGTV